MGTREESELEEFIEAAKILDVEKYIKDDEMLLDAYKRLLNATRSPDEHINDQRILETMYKNETDCEGGEFVCENDTYMGLYSGVVYINVRGNDPDFMEGDWESLDEEGIREDGSWSEASDVVSVETAVAYYEMLGGERCLEGSCTVRDFKTDYPNWNSDGYIEGLIEDGRLQEVMALAYESLYGLHDEYSGFIPGYEVPRP